MRGVYKVAVVGDLPKEFMQDINRCGGYRAWRDLVLLENSRTFKHVEVRKINNRIYQRASAKTVKLLSV